jgi:hypothetical protein
VALHLVDPFGRLKYWASVAPATQGHTRADLSWRTAHTTQARTGCSVSTSAFPLTGCECWLLWGHCGVNASVRVKLTSCNASTFLKQRRYSCGLEFTKDALNAGRYVFMPGKVGSLVCDDSKRVHSSRWRTTHETLFHWQHTTITPTSHTNSILTKASACKDLQIHSRPLQL